MFDVVVYFDLCSISITCSSHLLIVQCAIIKFGQTVNVTHCYDIFFFLDTAFLRLKLGKLSWDWETGKQEKCSKMEIVVTGNNIVNTTIRVFSCCCCCFLTLVLASELLLSVHTHHIAKHHCANVKCWVHLGKCTPHPQPQPQPPASQRYHVDFMWGTLNFTSNVYSCNTTSKQFECCWSFKIIRNWD